MSTASKKRDSHPFPGGAAVPAVDELRIAMEKRAYAEIVGHAVLEPDVEVCGVLVGTVGEDQHGKYLHITDIIRGEAAKQAGAQVTFTHDTWNHIHGEMDKRFTDKQIVGWYHTHGGFGIFLSDMDSFIHKNFFSEPFHVAYVFDPLAGAEGFFHLKDGEFQQARRYWLAGRERKVLAGTQSETDKDKGAPDLAAAVVALQRNTAALQTAMFSARGESSSSPLLWIIGGVAALAVMYALFFDGGLFRAERASSNPVLILQRDESSGLSVGLELMPMVHERGVVYRDATGRGHVGLELRGADGQALMQQLFADRGSTAPPVAGDPTPPGAPSLPSGPGEALGKPIAPSPLTVAIAVGVLVLMGAGAFLWWWRLRRRPAARS